MKKISLLNIQIDYLSRVDLLRKLESGGIVFTPNVDHLIKLQKDKEFYIAYDIATYKVCDSKILMYAAQFLGTPMKEKISGADLLPDFYNYYRNEEKMKIFLLGGEQGVANKAQRKINNKVGRNIIVGSYSPSWGFEKNPEECLDIVNLINKSGATVLAVGVGAPKQEKWIYKYKNKLPHIKIFMAIGAAIDFEAGKKPRSPKWMSDVGLEWLHRLVSEPQRLWKRYLIEDPRFFWLILQQKFNLYSKPFKVGAASPSLAVTKK